MSPKVLWILARLAFREAVRRRIVLAALLLGLAFLTLFNVGLGALHAQLAASRYVTLGALAPAAADNFLFLAGLYAVNFLTAAMAALIAADALAGEIAAGSLQTLVSKAVRRAEVVAGKWLGLAGWLALYLGLMAGGLAASVWLQTRYLAPNLGLGVGLIYLEGLLILSVTLLASSRLSALAAGGVVFGLYSLAVLGGWLEQVGSLIIAFSRARPAGVLQTAQTVMTVGFGASLIFPSEALWRRAAAAVQAASAARLGLSPFTVVAAPSGWLIVYAGLYALAALGLAVRAFTRRDL